MAKYLSFIVIILVLFVVVSVAIPNLDEKTDINLLFGTFEEVPVANALFVAFLLGTLMTFCYFLGSMIRMKLQIRKLGSRIRGYEQELTAIRNIPIEGAGPQVEETSPVSTGTD